MMLLEPAAQSCGIYPMLLQVLVADTIWFTTGKLQGLANPLWHRSLQVQGLAFLAGTVPMLQCLLGGTEKLDIFPLRRFGGTTRAAEDTGGLDPEEKNSLVGTVMLQVGLVKDICRLRVDMGHG